MNRIKELRNELNINQEVLAKLLGLEIAGISKLETGRVPLKDEYILKLSNYFNVSTDYLLCKSNMRNPEDKKQVLLDLSKIGFTLDKYNPPTAKQEEQLKAIIETILEENKKED